MRKTFLLWFLTIVCATQLAAKGVEINGIYYVFSGTDAIVTYHDAYPISSYAGDIVIPSSVTYKDTQYTVSIIGRGAFKNSIELTSITIPNTVTLIESSAFESCSGLTSITIPTSVKTIQSGAFAKCIGLTSIKIPQAVTSLGTGVFIGFGLTSIDVAKENSKYDSRQNCNAIIETATNTLLVGSATTIIPTTIVEIGEAAFLGIPITSITIPSSVTTIGESAFCGCNLQSITLSEGLTTICNSAFSDCKSLTSMTIPNTVTTIGRSAFGGCTQLKDITLPTSLTTINEGIFMDCQNLASIEIPSSVTTIGGHAFAYCRGLTSVTIPNSVTAIGSYAFYYCSSLTSVTIPDSVTTIYEKAFRYCDKLSSIYFGDAVANITPDICYPCPALKSIVVSPKNKNYDSRDNCNAIVDSKTNTLIFGCQNSIIPNTITNIGTLAFHDCSNLFYVNIPSSVTSIDEFAFYGCMNLKHVFNSSDLNITKGSKDYGYVACYADSVYKDCVCLDDFVIRQDSVLIGYIGKGANVSIPNEITIIADSAFANYSTLTSVVIPNSVETIGEGAFANCTYLTDVVIGTNVTNIGCNAFAGDFRLENITCYAPITPNICSTTFSGINKPYVYLYVPADNQRKYQVDPNWSGFSLHLISAEQKPIEGDDVIVTPSTDNATFTWVSNPSADGYSLEISKDGVVFRTLKFNAQGILTGIAFAPSRDGVREMTAAEMTANGWQFTVTGLDQASKYGYTLDVLNASQQSIKHYEGEFVTDGYTGLSNVSQSDEKIHKVIRDGILYIERNGKTYNALGGRVN